MFTKRNILILILFIFFGQVFNDNRVHASENYGVLNNQLNQLLQNSQELKGAIAGISIRSALNGDVIYDHFGDIRLRPASNLKLLTAASALSVLGEGFTFSTDILTDGKIEKGKLIGNLYLKGKGDPTLLKSDFDKMAEKLKKQGLKRVSGDLVGDDSWFDHIRYPLDLPWSDETTYYGAPISALTASPTADFDAGTVVIEVSPGKKVGAKPIIKVTPKTTAVEIINKAMTVPNDGKKELKIERQHDKKSVKIIGTIPLNAKNNKEWISVQEPTKLALDLFYQSIKKHDIKISGHLKTGNAPENTKILLTHHSMPLSDLVIPFMKLSNNGHAEVLVKEMGKVVNKEGTWEDGLKVFQNNLYKLGLNPKIMVLRDGSGVSHVDLVPASQISLLLYNIQRESWFPAYLHSLPIAGEKEKMVGGTLRKRLRDPAVQGRIRAKTGSISTVSSLSGYVDTKTGQRLIFSILLNNLLDEDKGKKIEDQIVTLLANQ